MPEVTKLATVKVVDPDDPADFIVINASDFKKGEHKLYVETPEERAATKAKPLPEPTWNYAALPFITPAIARKLKDTNYVTPDSFVQATEDALMNLGLGRQTVVQLKQAAADEIARRIEVEERAAVVAAASQPKATAKATTTPSATSSPKGRKPKAPASETETPPQTEGQPQ